MEKILLQILGLSNSTSHQGSFALLLGEANGKRKLPIVIGMFEAQAIAIELEKIVPNRPLTHDLFKAFADSFNFEVTEIYISELKEGIFFAQIICSDGINSHAVDARPSDAIAIGLRFGVDIYTNEKIMSEAGVVLSGDDEEQEAAEEKKTKSKSSQSKQERAKSFAEELQDLSTETLQGMLDESLNQEDYERAALIRDELNRRN